LVVLLFAGWIYAHGVIFDALHNVGLQNDATAGCNASGSCRPFYTNMTSAADQTFGVINTSITSLRLVAAVYIIALIIAIIIGSALVRLHPMWFFVYVLIVLLAVVFSAPISNAYESLLGSTIYDGELLNFTVANHILLNLPTYVLITGLLGAVFLFINMVRAGNEQINMT